MRTLVLAFLLAIAACAGAPKPAAPVAEARPIISGEQRIISARAFADERQINVWLPPSYATTDRRYPVLYLLDGAIDQDFPHIAGLAQYGALSGEFAELIVVGVETRDRRAELTWRSSDPAELRDFPTNGRADAFREFLTKEVMPLIETRYRTNGDRALMGESLAGRIVLETLMKAPADINEFVALSPSLWRERGSLATEAAARFDRYPKGDRRLYLAIADEAGAMRTAMLAVTSALRKSKPKGVAWTFSDRKDLQHSTIYHREALEALVWAFGAGPSK